MRETVATLLSALIESNAGSRAGLIRRILDIEKIYLSDKGKQAINQLDTILMSTARDEADKA